MAKPGTEAARRRKLVKLCVPCTIPTAAPAAGLNKMLFHSVLATKSAIQLCKQKDKLWLKKSAAVNYSTTQQDRQNERKREKLRPARVM